MLKFVIASTASIVRFALCFKTKKMKQEKRKLAPMRKEIAKKARTRARTRATARKRRKKRARKKKRKIACLLRVHLNLCVGWRIC